MENKTLYLPLKAKWYKMIESGIKKEEYRELKDFWIKRFCYTKEQVKNCDNCIKHYCKRTIEKGYNYSGYSVRNFQQVQFSYGYTSRTMTFEIDSIQIGVGKPEWGAPEKPVFIIKLGERLQ
ncbi:MAG: hypothetical protein HUK08_00290 [Bacteroidaceae bacterium]|nr:hypothetical protein [Bacteroidaceae bacterium]